MSPFKIAAFSTTALLATTALASATVAYTTQTKSYANLTDWGTSTPTPGFTPTQPLSFTGFNPALGTLLAVTITLSSGVNGSVDLINNGNSPTLVYANLLNTTKVDLPGLSQYKLTTTSTSYTDASLAAHSSSGNRPVSGTTSIGAISPAALALYETNWSALAGDLGTVNVGSGNGNGSATYTDTGKVTVSVQYKYSAVVVATPEPATLGLLGGGLVGLGALRRRRKA